MHLIDEISIRKTYADSRYRDRGPLSVRTDDVGCEQTILKTISKVSQEAGRGGGWEGGGRRQGGGGKEWKVTRSQ